MDEMLKNIINQVLEHFRNEIIREIDEKEKNILFRLNSEYRRIYEEAVMRYKAELSELEKRVREARSDYDMKFRREWSKRYNEYLEKVFDEALARISSLKRDEKYGRILEKLVEEGIAFMDTKVVHVDVSIRDVDLLMDIKGKLEEKHGIRIEVKRRIDSVGGVIIYNPDETIIVDNTFETRLKKIKHLLRPRVYKVLFGEN